MKIVREHIFEAFKEDSDPIEDMGIGSINIIKNTKNIYNTYGSHMKTYEYFDSFINKVISGIFRKRVKSGPWPPEFLPEEEYTLKISIIASYSNLTYVILTDINDEQYLILPDQKYTIY